MKIKLALSVVSVCAALSASGCGYHEQPKTTVSTVVTATPRTVEPSAALLKTNNRVADNVIRQLEERVRADPEDFAAYNRLAGYYLQRARETGSPDYLDLASRAARLSLNSVSEERNTGGLAALAQAEFASHDFTAARDHALQLTEIDTGKSYPFALLGDSLLELGDYDAATRAFGRMERTGGGISHVSESRQARLAFLNGNTKRASRHQTNALALALDSSTSPETIAWYHWQLGETSFAVGDYETAERHYRDALITFPDYFRAVAGLGRVRAAREDIKGAIEHYEQVVEHLPDPVFVAALGDLYKLAGQGKKSNAQYALVEQIARLNRVSGVLYNRQLALFYADHDMNAEEAYQSAVREYAVRRDIYGADALGWTALKAGRLAEAQAAMREALRLGTKDAMLFYHAGMIARAIGDERAARDYLQRALALNPQFDLLQVLIAKQALEDLS